jgi:glycosyltransferase involved in cell wall biosynthesis
VATIVRLFNFGKKVTRQTGVTVSTETATPAALSNTVTGSMPSSVSVIPKIISNASTYDIEEIEHSGLFDFDFYRRQAPGAHKYPRGAAAHFLEIGAAEGLSPNKLFDSAFYLSHNPDVAEAGKNSLLHFILHGATGSASPHPLFDIVYYLQSNPEVAKSGINPLLHYIRIGASEGVNPHPLFDTAFYKGLNQDSLACNENPLEHFLETCPVNHLSPHPLFDMSYYLSANQSIEDAEANPLLHYVANSDRRDLIPHPLFDTQFYLEQNPDGLNGDNPLVHFLTEGGLNGLNPHPLFDVSFYLELHPNVKKVGMNPLSHYIRFGAFEQLDPSAYFDNDFYTETYFRSENSQINPLIHYLTVGAKLGYNPSLLFNSRYYRETYLQTQPDVNPLVHYAKHGRQEKHITRPLESERSILANPEREINTGVEMPLSTRYTKLFEAMARPCKHLFLLGCLLRGGAERSACHCVRLAAEKLGNLEDVLVVVTDCSTISCAEWLPAGTRIVNLAELQTKLTVNDKGSLFSRIIAASGADTVHIFNSPRAHAAVAYYSEHYQKPSSKIYSYLCGYEIYADQNFAGFNDGALFQAAPYLDLIITDNNRLRETMNKRYQHVSNIETKAVTCYQPLTTALLAELSSAPVKEINSAERQKVVWASRIDPPKRPDILAKIAQCLPDVHFEVYGYSSSGYDFSYLRNLGNIKLMGEYSDFSQIVKSDKAMFLYTSDADGMPNVLLEAVASGLPIVAPDVGGIRELITDNSGWLVRRFDDIGEYVRLIKHVLDYPDEANDRCRRAQALLKQRHSWSAFSNRLTGLDVV